MALAAGQSLSFYEILGPLGAGGMGEVYRARDTRLGREVAIKVLPELLSADEERLRRLEREARSLAALNHPNVAGIHGVDRDGAVTFLALELVPGEDLAQRLSRGPLPVAEALDVCRQIAEGLEAAHETQIVHRDLKPANVRLTPEGVVKVLDFGLAKALRPAAATDCAQLTEEGTLLGTPTYMSPEQARGKPVDRRADIWAFGCVLYECLTGRRAFHGDSAMDVLSAVLHDEPDWRALPAGTPADVRRLLERALAKDPRERLRDIGEARLALRRATAGRAPRAPRVVAGALALLLVGGAFWVGGAWLAPGRPAAPDDTSIAVLPFQNLSGDPAAKPFVDGLYEDLIIRLSNVEGLKVTSKVSASRFEGSTSSVREIAERLGVSTVLQAGVQRRESTVRLTAQLTDGATDRNLWGEAFVEEIEVENVFDVQARLVEQVAERLARELTPGQREAIRQVPTTDLEAFELYVHGRDSWLDLTDASLERSLEYLTKATARDPSFARAYSAIADTYLGMEWIGTLPLDEAVDRARRSVEQALHLDPDLAEARSASGHISLHEMDGPRAEGELRRAIELNPSFLDAHLYLGMSLLDWGRLDEAQEQAAAALELDPLSTYTEWCAGLVRLARDDYAGAAAHFQQAIDLGDAWVGHYELAWVLSAQGQHERASTEIERALANASGALSEEFGLRATAAAFRALAGDAAGAASRLEELEGTAESRFAMGLARAALGEVDRAFEIWLGETEWTILQPAHFRYGPALDGIRDDPRYADVLVRIDERWGW